MDARRPQSGLCPFNAQTTVTLRLFAILVCFFFRLKHHSSFENGVPCHLHGKQIPEMIFKKTKEKLNNI